jgi:hypothetical protein
MQRAYGTVTGQGNKELPECLGGSHQLLPIISTLTVKNIAIRTLIKARVNMQSPSNKSNVRCTVNKETLFRLLETNSNAWVSASNEHL